MKIHQNIDRKTNFHALVGRYISRGLTLKAAYRKARLQNTATRKQNSNR